MRRIRIYLIAALSAGWLAPLWLSVGAFLNYMDETIRPEITGTGFHASFPFLQASRFLLGVTLIWLACVVVGWAVYFQKLFSHSLKNGNQ